MSNFLEKIFSLLPDNNRGLVKPKNVRDSFSTISSEIDKKASGTNGVLKITDSAPVEAGKYELVDIGSYNELVPILHYGEAEPSEDPIVTEEGFYNAVYYNGTYFTQIKTLIQNSISPIDVMEYVDPNPVTSKAVLDRLEDRTELGELHQYSDSGFGTAIISDYTPDSDMKVTHIDGYFASSGNLILVILKNKRVDSFNPSYFVFDKVSTHTISIPKSGYSIVELSSQFDIREDQYYAIDYQSTAQPLYAPGNAPGKSALQGAITPDGAYGASVTGLDLSLRLLQVLEKFVRSDNVDHLEIEDYTPSFIERAYLGTDGQVMPYNDDWAVSDFIPIRYIDHIYTDTGYSASATIGLDVAYYDADKTFLEGVNSDNYTEFKIEASDDALFFRLTQSMDNIKRLKFNKLSISNFLKIKDFIKNDKNLIRWCAIGDSITAGNETNTETSYATYTASKFENVSLDKLGYWGHTMRSSLAGLAFDAIVGYPDIITINFGSNDIAVDGPTLWGDVDTIMGKTYEELVNGAYSLESLRLFIEKCRLTYPKAIVKVISPIKRAGEQSVFIDKEKELCSRMGIEFYDANSESGIAVNDSIYLSDGVHPNPAGKAKIANWLAGKINLRESYRY